MNVAELCVTPEVFFLPVCQQCNLAGSNLALTLASTVVFAILGPQPQQTYEIGRLFNLNRFEKCDQAGQRHAGHHRLTTRQRQRDLLV